MSAKFDASELLVAAEVHKLARRIFEARSDTEPGKRRESLWDTSMPEYIGYALAELHDVAGIIRDLNEDLN